jgi:hypothetical protein
MLAPRQLHNIVHPFINSIYLKKEFGADTNVDTMDILVIEARRISATASQEERDAQLLSFLADLDLIKDQVESKAGKFNRVDIRYCQ